MLSTSQVTKAYYHSLLLNLPAHKRAFLDPNIEADKYYIAYKGSIAGGTIGAFATTGRGYLTGLFSLKKGYGKKLFKVQVKHAIENINPKLDVTNLGLFCTGNMLRDFFIDKGFKVNMEFPWDDKLAHPKWDYKRYGRPKLYTMLKEI